MSYEACTRASTSLLAFERCSHFSMGRTAIVVSELNRTVQPLAATESYVGTSENVTRYQELDVVVGGSPEDASGTLWFDFSIDGAHWDIVSSFELDGLKVPPITLRIVAPYFRVRYINGETPQVEFRLHVILHEEGATNPPVAVASRMRVVPASTSPVLLAAANVARKQLTIVNNANAILFIARGPEISIDTWSFFLVPGSLYVFDPPVWSGIVMGFWSDTVEGQAQVTEDV